MKRTFHLLLMLVLFAFSGKEIYAQCSYPAPVSQDANINCGQTATLTATGSGPNISWYDQALGGNPIFNGPVFTTPVLVNSKTYYVETNDHNSGSVQFDYTGSQQVWMVPAGVTSIDVEVYGAQGGSTQYSNGGLGGVVKASMAVTPGETLYVYVGEQPLTGNGGYNGGGGCYNYCNTSINKGGGGGTDIRKGGFLLTNRIIVAGGGGGAGYNATNNCAGGGGGGLTALDGLYNGSYNATYSGMAGTQTVGGSGSNRYQGNSFSGGTSNNVNTTYSSGGGGGGWYGGSGGYYYGGGGGGSSYADPTQFSNITHQQAIHSGNGKVIISYSSGTCQSVRVPVVVNVDQNVLVPTATGIQSFCGTATLNASGSTGMYEWFKSPYDMVPFDTGSSISIPVLLNDTIFYVRAVDNYSNPLCMSPKIGVMVDVIPLPMPILTDTVTINCGDRATLNVAGPSGKFQWFDSANSSTPFDTGTSIQTPPLGLEKMYYVRGVNDYTNPQCFTGLDSVYVKLISPNAPNTVDSIFIACGDTLALQASGSTGFYKWYDQAQGGSVLGYGAQYNTGPIFADTAYFYAEAYDTIPATPIVFDYTGSAQTWTVPAGITEITVELEGAQGGSNTYSQGGLGGYVKAKIPVTPGQVLNLYVGGTTSNYLGGWNGGANVTSSGTHSRGGGGATDIRIGGTSLNDRILVAGGGGGAGYYSSNIYNGGAGGGLTAANGDSPSGNNIGYGATQSSGGTSSYESGSLGNGGRGYQYGSSYVGGGGGGGYYGGGGGYSWCCYNASGGGGGSSFTHNSATNVSHIQGHNVGNGKITIHYAEDACPSPRKKITIVSAEIPVPTATDETITCGEDVTLNVSGSNGKYFWFSDSLGTNLIGKGNSYSISRLQHDTTLYVAAVSDTANLITALFNFTGNTETWTVPMGITEIEVEIAGAQGGSTTYSSGGLGGLVKAKIPVTPGQVLNLNVGGTTTNYLGGWNGGGQNSSNADPYTKGGGGASDIRLGGTALNDRILVAGGGGGAGYYSSNTSIYGGAGGGLVGGTGGTSSSYLGYGGTQSAGGGSSNQSGSLGQGGNGNYYTTNYSGGGGGGGYYGGGGGYSTCCYYGSGGGGGSSYTYNLASDVVNTQGVNSGPGYIKITYAGGYCKSNLVAVDVTVNPVPAPVVNPIPSIACGATAVVNVTSSTPYVDWFASPNATTPFASGTHISLPPLYTTDTFWVESKSWIPVPNGNVTFNYTGSVQTFTVPAGVTEIEVELAGAQGGSNNWSRGGFGAVVKSKMNVTPGQVLQIYVGEQPSGIAAGWPNGGAGYNNSSYSRGGGGSSDIRINGTTLSDRVIVAGAGGGASYNSSSTNYCRGGNAGLNGIAENGYYNNSSTNTSYCGFGASQFAGGNSGNGYGTPYQGSIGLGGNAYTGNYGGGGGGGYYGGGGGYYYGGGGGGSSYIDPAHTFMPQYVDASNTGNGYVKINYSVAQPCVSARVPFVVYVDSLTAPTIVTGDTTLCENGNATFGVQPIANATFSWANTTNPNTSIGNGTTFTTNPLSNTSSFQVGYMLNNCISQTASVTATVIPAPATGIIDPGSLCSDANSIVLQALNSGGTWSGTGISDPINGIFDVANATPGLQTVYYTVSDPITTCSATDTATFMVIATPDASIASSNQTLCENGTVLNLLPTNPGGTWSGIGIDPINGDFDPAIAGPGTHMVYYTLANGVCSDKDSISIDVNPIPNSAISNAPSNICESAALFNFTAITPNGVWSGNGITNAATGEFDPSSVNPGTHTITHTLTINGCTSSSTTSIHVDTNIVPTISTANLTLCSSDAPVYVSATPALGSWTGTGIDANGLFDPSISGSGNFVLSYTITNGSCISKDSITATVTNTPVTTITNAPAQICESASAFQLQAVDPNGTWSGTGITDAVLGTFDPAVANQGTHTITYSITANGCSSSSTISIQVDDLIVPTISNANMTMCSDAGAVQLNATPANGIWSGNGVNSNGLFNPSTLVNGIYNTIYTINNGACSASDTIIITVNQRPDAQFQPTSLSYCESVGNVALNPVQYGGVWSGNGISNPNDPIFNPSIAGIGIHVITYTIDNNGCIDTYTQSITVTAAPSVQINSGNTEVCLNSSSFTLSGIPFGGVWSGNGITNSASGSFSPQMANPGTHQVVYTVYGGGCYNSDTVSIHVGAIPQSNFDIVGLCENENASFTDLSSISNGSIQSWQWNFGDGQSSTLQNPLHTYNQTGNYTVSLQVTSDLGCTNTLSKLFQVHAGPDALWNASANGNLSLQFAPMNPTTGADYLWTFGDGGLSNLINPQHIYANGGNYTVCLTVEKNGCSNTECQEITAVNTTGNNENPFAQSVQVFPNPFIDNFNITIGSNEDSNVQVKLYDMTGRLILAEKRANLNTGEQSIQIQANNLLPGFYNLEISTNNQVFNTVLIKQ